MKNFSVENDYLIFLYPFVNDLVLFYVFFEMKNIISNTYFVVLIITGGSDDWAKGGAGIKYSYTIELPDTGRYGFVLPASKALKTGREAMALTEAMIAAL